MPSGLGLLVSGSPFVLDQSLSAALWFLLAAVILDLFDVSLPRGDSAGVCGALCGAAVIVVGPLRAAIIAVLSAVIAHAARRGKEAPVRLATIVLSRVTALVAASLLLAAFPPSAPPTLLYLLLPALYLAVELVAGQAFVAFISGRPVMRLLRGNASSQTPLVIAQWSASVLLLLTYSGMGSWSLIPVAALLLLMRQSYAMFLDIRETYRTTVEVLVEAAECQDSRRVGHAERSAGVARRIAMRIGVSAHDVERISYAALLHDLGELADGADSLSPSEHARTTAAEVVQGVDFFQGIQPILAVCAGTDAGAISEDVMLACLIVALASDIDAEYHPAVAAAHDVSAVNVVAPRVTPEIKARVVGAALRLGYRIPAVA